MNTIQLYTKCSFLTTKRESFSKFLAGGGRKGQKVWREGARHQSGRAASCGGQGKKTGEKAGFC
jgi:hypothetical protein